MIDQEPRVAVTGIGVVSALGMDEETVWERLSSGQGGIGKIRSIDTRELRAKVGAEIDEEHLTSRLENLGRRPTDRALDMALVAAADALGSAGWTGHEGPLEITTLVGTGMGPADTFYEAYRGFSDKGVRGLRPTTVPRAMYNSLSAALSIQFGLIGPNYVVVSACSSATNAIGDGYRRIREGRASVVLCGGTEAFFNRLFLGVWSRLGVLSKSADALRACRPFDRDRDGCVLGEGAGMLVLESLADARARRAEVRGEILGYGESSDAEHITRPSADGQERAMREALTDAGIEAGAIDYVNAHGTATRSNDPCEAASIRAVLGAGEGAPLVGALKGYFGHTLGASGALETIATLWSLERRIAIPNLNLDQPDPECDLRFVGASAEPLDGATAMKNSFGFGGGNAVLIVRGRPE